MKQWWMNLAERERQLLRIGSVVAALLLGYSLVWEPLQQQRDSWRSRAVAADQALLWMRAIAPQVQALPVAAVQSNDGRSLLARVDLGAREAGLGGVLLRVEPINANQVRVYFQAAPFDRLMEWLQPLAASQGVRVEELSVQRASGVGLVDVRMTLVQTQG